jgi:hypothetical protein
VQIAGAPLFFNHMVVVLDRSFVHRSRTLEKKDVVRLFRAFFAEMEKTFV